MRPDAFAPFKEGCVQFPKDINLHWIGAPKDVDLLRVLIGQPLVGVDAEWRCSAVNAFTSGADKGPAIIQLSSETDACIVDLIGLSKCKALDDVLTELFLCEKTVIVGFAFSGDLEMLEKYMPQFRFYREIARLADLQVYYSAVY